MEDANSIYNLNCSEMGYEYPVDKTKNKLEHLLKSNKDKIFVATVQSIVVGYIHANDYDTIYAPHMKNIMGIAVSSEYKKKGIGRAIRYFRDPFGFWFEKNRSARILPALWI